MGLCYLAETIRNRPQDLAQTAASLQLPSLGAVPRVRSLKAGDSAANYLAIGEEAQEAYRMVRTLLSSYGVADAVKTILVTSPRPHEGKSVTVGQLASAYAKEGKRVTVIDADLRAPSQHRILGLDNKWGLNVLLDKKGPLGRASDKDERVSFQAPAPPLFRVIPSQQSLADVTELLASSEMEKVIQMAQKMSDLVLIDSAPVSSGADALVLASKVDAIILLTDPEVTDINGLIHAQVLLQQVGGKLIGLLFNKVDPAQYSYSGYYEYYSKSLGYPTGRDPNIRSGGALAVRVLKRRRRTRRENQTPEE